MAKKRIVIQEIDVVEIVKNDWVFCERCQSFLRRSEFGRFKNPKVCKGCRKKRGKRKDLYSIKLSPFHMGILKTLTLGRISPTDYIEGFLESAYVSFDEDMKSLFHAAWIELGIDEDGYAIDDLPF